MHQPLSWAELQALLARAFSGESLGAWALLLACLGAAALLSWALSRAITPRKPSVLFGGRIVDGALFPLLALGLAFAARRALPALGLPPALFKLALPVLVSLAVIRLVARVLRAAWPASAAIKAVEKVGSWGVWGATVLWVTGLLPVLLEELDGIGWKFGSVHMTLRNLLEGSVTAGVVLVLALWLSASFEARLLKREGMDLSMRKIAANAVRALLLFVGLLFALSAAGIDLTALGVLGGALGVGLGFGLQKLAANYVSGFVILAERSLRIGDVIRVDGFEGRVLDIKTRYTLLRSASGKEALVPNELLITQRVENSSLADPRALLTSQLVVEHGSDLAALMPALASAAAALPQVLDAPAPTVLLSQFTADGMELQLQYWTREPETAAVRSEVNLAVLATLQRLGLALARPQRVLHGLAGVQGLAGMQGLATADDQKSASSTTR
jgi:small-conductance mechanosensitive channel